MPIPSGCCSRLAFRCVRFPAAVLSLRFYRRAGFPVPSVQSFVRALRCASVSRQRPSACGFPPCRISRSVRPAVSRSFGLSVVHPFPGSGPRLAVFRRAGFPVPSVRQSVVRSGSPLCIRFPAAALGLRFSAVPGFPSRPDSRSFGLSVVRPFSGCVPRLAVLSPRRVSRSVGLPDVSDSLPPTFSAASLSVALLCLLLSLPLLSLCLLLSLQPHSLLPPRLYRCGRRLAGII